MTFLGKLMKNLTPHSKFKCFPSLLFLNIKCKKFKYIGNSLTYTGTPILRNNIFKSVVQMSITFTLIYHFVSGLYFSKQDSTLNRNREFYFSEKSYENKLGSLSLSLKVSSEMSLQFNYNI